MIFRRNAASQAGMVVWKSIPSKHANTVYKDTDLALSLASITTLTLIGDNN